MEVAIKALADQVKELKDENTKLRKRIKELEKHEKQPKKLQQEKTIPKRRSRKQESPQQKSKQKKQKVANDKVTKTLDRKRTREGTKKLDSPPIKPRRSTRSSKKDQDTYKELQRLDNEDIYKKQLKPYKITQSTDGDYEEDMGSDGSDEEDALEDEEEEDEQNEEDEKFIDDEDYSDDEEDE